MFRISPNPDPDSTLPHLLSVSCETRPLAQEWTHRFLGAARRCAEEEAVDR
jgi:hypothetical protein